MNQCNVSIISPCKNEVNHIDSFINQLLNQSIFDECEFIIADGNSNDGTKEKLLEVSNKYSNIIIIDNPKGIVSAALNEGIKISSNEIIVRMDIHTEYDQFYIENCVKVLLESNANCVGGPWAAKINENKIQSAIASAFQSKFVAGGAKSRNIFYSGYVDTVYLGCWKKDYLIEIGGFDEELVRNQDDELCMRIRMKKGKIFQSKEIKSSYLPRSSFKDLFRQYLQYGFWKIFVIKKHKRTPSLRHLVLMLFFLSVCFGFFLGMLIFEILLVTSILVASYLLSVLALAFIISSKDKKIKAYYVTFSILIMHLSYSFGMIIGLLENIFSFKKLLKMDKISR